MCYSSFYVRITCKDCLGLKLKSLVHNFSNFFHGIYGFYSDDCFCTQNNKDKTLFWVTRLSKYSETRNFSFNDIKKLPNIIRLLSICPELTLTRTNPSTNLEAHSNHKILAGYFTYVPQLQCILCVRPCENISV